MLSSNRAAATQPQPSVAACPAVCLDLGEPPHFQKSQKNCFKTQNLLAFQ